MFAALVQLCRELPLPSEASATLWPTPPSRTPQVLRARGRRAQVPSVILHGARVRRRRTSEDNADPVHALRDESAARSCHCGLAPGGPLFDLARLCTCKAPHPFNIELKLGFWRTLPWILFGTGHSNLAVARGCGQRALQLYMSNLDAQHHWVSMLLCHPGGEGHAQLVLFVSGEASLVDLSVVARMAARFRFTPCVERWIEGRHAQALAHLRATRHASVVHIAFSGPPCCVPLPKPRGPWKPLPGSPRPGTEHIR